VESLHGGIDLDAQLTRRRRFPEEAGHLAVELLKHAADIGGVEIFDVQTVMLGCEVRRSRFRAIGARITGRQKHCHDHQDNYLGHDCGIVPRGDARSYCWSPFVPMN